VPSPLILNRQHHPALFLLLWCEPPILFQDTLTIHNTQTKTFQIILLVIVFFIEHVYAAGINLGWSVERISDTEKNAKTTFSLQGKSKASGIRALA